MRVAPASHSSATPTSGWPVPDQSGPDIYRQHVIFDFLTDGCASSWSRAPPCARCSLTYLTSRKLMAKVGAIYDQPQTNREPDAAESANQKRAAVALSAC
jgi:hypothetical protein